MYYILNELPDGLKGFVTVGAIAAALSSTNSVLSALASVAVEDIYKPWIVARRTDLHPHHFLRVARLSVLGFASLLLVMVVVSYEWQHVAKIPLVSFALGVMSFAYSGLLGVFFSAVFTQRGDAQSVPYALGGGFLVVLFLQPYFFGIHIGFAWQIVIATGVSFAIMQMKRGASYG
jgi:Na+/proline symporter